MLLDYFVQAPLLLIPRLEYTMTKDESGEWKELVNKDAKKRSWDIVEFFRCSVVLFGCSRSRGVGRRKGETSRGTKGR